MKIFKKLFVTFITVSPILAIDETSQYPTLRELISSGELDLKELVMPEEYSLNEYVAAAVSVYSTSTGASSSSTQGHSWIVIRERLATRTYGNYSLSNGSSITMGTWGNKGYNGICYNSME